MKSNYVLYLLMVVMLLVSVSGAFAVTPSLTIPANGGTITGANALFNATCTDCGAGSLYNVTYRLQGITGANTSVFTLQLFQSVNFSVDNSTRVAKNFTTLIYEDGIYSASVVITNETSATATNTGIILDNTVPTAPSSCTSNNFQNLTYTLECTVIDSTTTNVTINWLNGVSPVSPVPSIVTYTTGTRAYIVISTSAIGTFGYQMVASDGKDTATGNAFYVSARRSNGGLSSGVESVEASPTLSIVSGNLPTQVTNVLTNPTVRIGAGATTGALIGFFVPIPGATIAGAIIGALVGAFY